ncbi:hypothetical protein U1Q18_028486 [Sarracenia purpurea var. burkii]
MPAVADCSPGEKRWLSKKLYDKDVRQSSPSEEPLSIVRSPLSISVGLLFEKAPQLLDFELGVDSSTTSLAWTARHRDLWTTR